MPESIVGKMFRNKYGLEFVVLSKIENRTRRYKVKFVITGYETEIHYSGIFFGSVKDKYSKDIYGVACIGNASCSENMKEYSVWHSMIQRCYAKNTRSYANYGKVGVTVCDRWLCFENFLSDLHLIEGYDKEKFSKGEIQLDKDSKQLDSHNKTYSLDTCVFLSPTENTNLANKPRMKEFEAISPSGEVYISINASNFAREHDLKQTSVAACLVGKRNSHKGWKFKYLE